MPTGASPYFVQADLVGATVHIDKEGFSATRHYLIQGPQGPQGAYPAPDAMVYYAVENNAIPNYGSIHPTMTALYAGEIDARGISPSEVMVDYKYKPFVSEFIASSTQAPKVFIQSSLTSQTTNKDSSGSLIKVNYTGPQGGPQSQTGTIAVDKPMFAVRYERLEPSNPQATAIGFTGYINTSSISIMGFTYSAKCLRCDGINANPVGGSSTSYNVQYLFTYNPNGWNYYCSYQSSDGTIPGDVVDGGNGTTTGQAYPDVDFSTLNIPT